MRLIPRVAPRVFDFRRMWGASALASLILLQALAVRFALNRITLVAAFAILAFTTTAILTAPGAVRTVIASIRALRTHLQWWHCLWLLLFLSDLVFRVRETTELQDAPVDFWAAYRMGLIGCASFVLVLRFVVGKNEWARSLCMGLVPALGIYCVVCAVSTVWSVYPAWTGYKSVEYFVDVCVVAAILAHVQTTERFKSLFDWTWLLMTGLMATVWIGAVVWPDLAFTHDPGMVGIQIVGVMPEISANGVGELSAVLAIATLTRILLRQSGRGFYTLIFVAGAATMFMAQTRSALMAFAFAIAVLLFFSKRIGVSTLLIVVVALIVVQTSASEILWKYFLRGQDQTQFGTLSGRTGWWSIGWQKYMDRPFTGYGAYAGGRFVALAEIEQQGTTSSLHNTFFEILLGTGPWGVIPVVVALVGAWWFLLRALKTAGAAMSAEKQLILEALAVLALVTLRSVFTTHLIWHPSLSFLLVFAFAEFLRRKRRGLISSPQVIRISI